MHMVLDGQNWRAALARHGEKPLEGWVRTVLAAYRQKGFTWLRDGGDRWGVSALARRLAPEYGICYRTPLSPLHKKGHYGGFIGTAFENLAEFALLVRQQRQQGADFIKIMISGLMDFDRFGVLTEEGLGAEEIGQMIHIAHSEGMAVMAHANGSANVLAAARAGVDSVEHGAYLNREALAAMAEAGTVWVPTLSTVAQLRGKGRFCEEAVCKILDSGLQTVAAYAALGGPVAPGTDAGAWQAFHATDSEYRLLRQAGVEPRAGITALQNKF